jgi:hypothetical protein
MLSTLLLSSNLNYVHKWFTFYDLRTSEAFLLAHSFSKIDVATSLINMSKNLHVRLAAEKMKQMNG